jgi:hypothetical protein
VYGHINPITKKFFYIGKGTGERSVSTEGRNRFWHNTVNKYGFAAIKLVDGLTNEQALEIEKQYIQKYGLRIEGGLLVNFTRGGQAGCVSALVTPETKDKLRKSKIGPLNPNYGKRTWNYGKPRTEAERKKMSDAKRGVRQSEERKKASRAALVKAREAQTAKMFRIQCAASGRTWKNRNECMKELGLTLSQLKDRLKANRITNKLIYLKNL